jgi:hypothetical protein
MSPTACRIYYEVHDQHSALLICSALNGQSTMSGRWASPPQQCHRNLRVRSAMLANHRQRYVLVMVAISSNPLTNHILRGACWRVRCVGDCFSPLADQSTPQIAPARVSPDFQLPVHNLETRGRRGLNRLNSGANITFRNLRMSGGRTFIP